MKEIKGVVAPKPKESPPQTTTAELNRQEKTTAKYQALHAADQQKNAPAIDAIRNRWNPPPMRPVEARRQRSAVEQDMEDSFNATPAGREVGAAVKAGTMDTRPLTADEMRSRDTKRMLLDALPAAKTKADQDRIYAQLYAQKGKQAGGQHPNL